MSVYLSFIKVEHTLFSLPVVFSGAFLALAQNPGLSLSWEKALWIILAALGARAAGFGINRLVDREIDAQNPRTREREIPSGKISPRAALLFIVTSAALFLLAAARLSRTCFLLAPIPLALFWIYPYLKLWTPAAHLGLGLAWGIAPLGGWLAIWGRIPGAREILPALQLAAFSVFWVAGFDILYSLLDESFDRARGLFSAPAVWGRAKALRLAKLLHFVGFLFLGSLAQAVFASPIAFVFLGTVGGLLLLSQGWVATRPLSPPVIDFAFFKVNAALGFAVFLLIWMGGRP